MVRTGTPTTPHPGARSEGGRPALAPPSPEPHPPPTTNRSSKSCRLVVLPRGPGPRARGGRHRRRHPPASRRARARGTEVGGPHWGPLHPPWGVVAQKRDGPHWRSLPQGNPGPAERTARGRVTLLARSPRSCVWSTAQVRERRSALALSLTLGGTAQRGRETAVALPWSRRTGTGGTGNR